MTFGWRDAEELAAEHMRTRLRFYDACLSVDGADGGIDVRAREAMAQVKFYANPVGIADVQRLRGAVWTSQYAIFYAHLAGYTKSARDFARASGVALFRYSEGGIVAAVNTHATLLLKTRSAFRAELESDGLTPMERLTLTVRASEIRTAIGQVGKQVTTLVMASSEQMAVIRRLLTSASTDEEYRGIRERYLGWIEHYEAEHFHPAVQTFHEAVSETDDADPIARVRQNTELLDAAPALAEPVYAALPLARAEAGAWRDFWSAHRQRRWDGSEDWPEDIQICSCGESLAGRSHPFLRDDIPATRTRPAHDTSQMWPPLPSRLLSAQI